MTKDEKRRRKSRFYNLSIWNPSAKLPAEHEMNESNTREATSERWGAEEEYARPFAFIRWKHTWCMYRITRYPLSFASESMYDLWMLREQRHTHHLDTCENAQSGRRRATKYPSIIPASILSRQNSILETYSSTSSMMRTMPRLGRADCKSRNEKLTCSRWLRSNWKSHSISICRACGATFQHTLTHGAVEFARNHHKSLGV